IEDRGEGFDGPLARADLVLFPFPNRGLAHVHQPRKADQAYLALLPQAPEPGAEGFLAHRLIAGLGNLGGRRRTKLGLAAELRSAEGRTADPLFEPAAEELVAPPHHACRGRAGMGQDDLDLLADSELRRGLQK